MKTRKQINILKLLLFLISALIVNANSQGQEIKFRINDNSFIVFTTNNFDSSKHSLEYDKTGNLILIDSLPFYGSSIGFPNNMLEKAVLTIDEQEISLDTKGITNFYLVNDPDFRLNEKGLIEKEILKLEKINNTGDCYILRFGFSDGADACVVIYDIRNNSSSRILIMSDLDYSEYGLEKYFFKEQ